MLIGRCIDMQKRVCSSHEYRESRGCLYTSPFYRLMQDKTCCSLYIHEPFPGISIETISAHSDVQDYYFRFTERHMPLLFSLRLSGSGITHLEGVPQTISYSQGQLAVSYFPNRNGEISIKSEEYCQVNVTATPEALQRHISRENLPSILNCLIQQKENTSITVITAPALLVAAGRNLLNPPVSKSMHPIYLQGASLLFLSLAIDALHTSSCSKSINFLNQCDRIKLSQVKKHIETNLDNPPSIEKLSKMFYINTFKLKNGFKLLYGMSVAAYIQYCRVTYAYNRFIRGETNVSQCAWEVGYTNVSHFISAFRKHYGYTPGEVIRKQKESIMLNIIPHDDTKFSK